MATGMEDARPVRGNRQRQRTRKALMSAGQRLFAAQGGSGGVSIDEIVESADVSKGSFYNHFDDKESFAHAIRESVQEDLEHHVTSANRDIVDPAARIVRALCVVMAYASDHPDRLQALLSLSERRTRAGSPLNTGVNADIAEGLRSGRLSVADAETGVLVVIGLIIISVRHAMSGEASASRNALAIRMGTALLKALGVPEGEAGRLADEAAADVLEENSSPAPKM